MSSVSADSFALYKRLVRTYVLRYKSVLIIAGLCMLVVAVTTATTAYLLQPTIDKIFVDKNTFYMVAMPLAFIVVGFLNAAGDFGQQLSLKYVGQRVVSDMQLDLFSHLVRSDITLFHDQSSGRLISRLTNDIMLMRQSVSQVFTGVIKETCTMVFLGALLIYKDWQMSLLAIFILVFAVMPITKLGKRMRRIADATQAQLADFTAQLDDIFQGARVVKSYGREDYEVERARLTIRQLFKLYYRASRTQSLAAPIVGFVGTTAMAAVIAFSGYRAIHHGMTAGEITSFIASMVMAYRPVRVLAGLNTQLQEGMAAAGRFFSVIDTEPSIQDAPDAKEMRVTRGEIVVKDATFFYHAGSGGIEQVSFTVPAGKTVALVGASGSGKTTLMNLLLRFYELQSGSITIDGVDIRHVTLASLRQSFAFVSQDIVLFNETVRSNIAYGKLDATDEDIIEAAKKAHAHDFVLQLPHGYNTQIGPSGVKLSGGQRQRLSIARAVLKNAPILLLDEATSALDNTSERAVQEALIELMRGRTTLVIAHRLSTIQEADKILVLAAGHIQGEGTHSELLEGNNIYRIMHQNLAPQGTSHDA